jgi:ATPase family protein associated with various cellular activities (AAA)/ClpX C4-type zinc finger protein
MEGDARMPLLTVSRGRCQFCHAQGSDAERIIAGDSGFICEDCVSRCVTLLKPVAAPEVQPERSDRYVFQRLMRHFEPLPLNEVQATSRSYPLRQQADLQLSLDELFGERKVPDNFIGAQHHGRHDAANFTRLVSRDRGAVEIGPAQHQEIDIGRDESVRCLRNGVWLLRERDVPFAVVLSFEADYQGGGSFSIDVAAPPGEFGAGLCARIFDALEKRLSQASCYRGRVLSLEQSHQWAGGSQRIRVHELESVRREDVILGEATLRAIERNVLQFARQRDALRKMGMSTQKGLLFHGPPGTGKTHCIRYLSAQLPTHTTLLVTAEQVGLLPVYMSLARLLQPALMVIEDADLIGRNREEAGSACDEVMLNQLLNELDGLRERADVFFVLTTNRPEALEPALANRPGRIDQSIEFPLPSEEMRRRLIRLYARGLELPDDLVEELAKRTERASPAFIKELMRRIAQNHLEAAAGGAVTRGVAEAALHEMLFSGGALNARLLGGQVEGT